MLIAAYGRKKEVYLGELSERIAHLDFDEKNELYYPEECEVVRDYKRRWQI